MYVIGHALTVDHFQLKNYFFMNSNQKVWFITGGNKGLGAAMVKEALANGYQVVASARSVESAEKTLGTHPNLLIVKLDITNDQQVKDAVSAAMERFGQI